MRLAAHCRDSWARRLRAPTRMRPQHGDRFLMDYFPRPPDGGPPLLPYARRPPRAPARSVPLAAPQRSRPPGVGSGTQGALCLVHGAPSCARCRSLGWGISRCCRASHTGHAGPSGSSSCPVVPPRVAPGRQVLVPEARRAGAAALASRLGRARPASQALPNSGPRRRAGVRPRPGCWARALPSPRGRTPPGPRSARRLTGLIGRPPGGCHTGSRVRGPRTPYHPSHQGGGTNPIPTPRRSPPAGRTRERRRVGGGLRGPACPGQWGGGGGARHRDRPPPSPPAGAGASAEPGLRQDAPPPAAPPPLPGRATPGVATQRVRPHLCGPEQPRAAAAEAPPAGATTPPQSRQDGGGHDVRAPALPAGHGRRSGRGPPLPPH